MRRFTARDRLKYLSLLAAYPLAACSNGGSSSQPSPPAVGNPPPNPPTPPPAPITLTRSIKDAYAGRFPFGAAIQTRDIDLAAPEDAIIREHFSSITAEFEMKPDPIAQSPGVNDFTRADQLVAYAEANSIAVRGHALLWHQATPDFFVQGTPSMIRYNLETYINDVLARYNGRIYAWDVVNEVVTDNGGEASAPYRSSQWFNAVGKDYIDWAFQAARAADPSTKLFINDYGTEGAGKRGRLIAVIEDLLNRGIPLDGVGHQAHLSINDNADDLMAAIDAVDALGAGLENHITELDVSVYSDPGSCFSSQTGCQASYGDDLANIPESVINTQAQLYRNVLNGAVARPSVTSVTVWGVSDADTWLNNFPVSRPNHPLLFDRSYNPKTAAAAITDPAYVI